LAPPLNVDDRVDDGRTTTGRFASRFFLAGVGLFAAAFTVTGLLRTVFPPAHADARLPSAFAATTVLLALVSSSFTRAVHFVRREKQRRFRHSLYAALAAGTLFVGIQAYGLNCLLATRPAIPAQTGSLAFVFVFAAMHALHVTVALLFLLFVTMRAHRDRYDHEYYWGVAVAGWFWHALGIAWLAILFVIILAA
jgi:cytochrome c oxidase subunit III